MTLTGNNLTINVGDEVSFRTATNDGDNVYLTGKVKGSVKGDQLTLLVFVNEFLIVTIDAKSVSKVNNVFISQIQDNLNLTIGI